MRTYFAIFAALAMVACEPTESETHAQKDERKQLGLISFFSNGVFLFSAAYYSDENNIALKLVPSEDNTVRYRYINKEGKVRTLEVDPKMTCTITPSPNS